MRVYLVRHGQAKPREQDPERGLTDEGRREVEAVARLVAREAVSLRRIWHSGKRRAAETAGILAEFLAREGASAAILERPGLSPDDPVAPLAAELATLAEDVAVVGHLPFLDKLAVTLVGADPRRIPRVVAFDPGAMLCLERAEETWLIAWFLAPRPGFDQGSPVGR